MGNVFGFEIESELPLVRLRERPGPRGTIRVVRDEPAILDGPAEITALDMLELPDGDLSTFVIGREGDRRVVGCSHTGGFVLEPDHLAITAAPAGPAEMWEHRLLSVIVPIMLASRGEVALHGAVVEIGGKAAIFCGPAFRGKSTLALTFAELGHAVLSEDGIVLEEREGEWIAWPAAKGARIRTRPGSPGPSKVLTGLPGPEAEPLPVGTVVLLAPRGGTGVADEITSSAALLELAPHLMHTGGIDAVRPAFSGLARLLSAVPAARLSLPDDLGTLPTVAESVADALPGLAAGRVNA